MTDLVLARVGRRSLHQHWIDGDRGDWELRLLPFVIVVLVVGQRGDPEKGDSAQGGLFFVAHGGSRCPSQVQGQCGAGRKSNKILHD